MVFGMLMRNSKLRTGLYVFVAIGMCLTIYMLRSTHDQLNDTRNQYETCQQQKDSLLAQMQVVYEQKNRVEKYLQQERQDHKQTKSEHQKSNELRILTEKDKREVESKYTELQKDHQLLDEKKQQLESQLSQLQEAQNQKEEEKKHLQTDLNAQLHELQYAKDQEIGQLKGQISALHAEKEKLQWELNQQEAKLQVCQSKHSELEKQLNNVNVNNNPGLPQHHILKPEVRYLSDTTKKTESSKGDEKPQVAIEAGDGINGAPNNNPPENNHKISGLQVLVNGVVTPATGGSNVNGSQPLAAPKLPNEGLDAPKPGGGLEDSGGGGGGGVGGDMLPVDSGRAKVANTIVQPLQLPQSEKTTRSSDVLHNPAGLQEQIQPPNSAILNPKKMEDEKDVDAGKEHIALQELRPQVDVGHHIPDSRMMVDQQRNIAVENNLMRPYLGPHKSIVPQHFPVMSRRGPQIPDHHNQGRFDHLREVNNEYDEGKAGLK